MRHRIRVDAGSIVLDEEAVTPVVAGAERDPAAGIERIVAEFLEHQPAEPRDRHACLLRQRGE
jgi:hypothetical protein